MYDVKVIGAGPAGSFCANHLARLGYSVQLVDRATFPRDKLCGGVLTLKSLNLLRRLEPSFDNSGLAEYIHDLVLVQPTTLEQSRTRIGRDCIALVHRRDFDAWLLQRALDAGVEFSPTPGEARFTVAADGAGSQLGPTVRGAFRNDEIAVATECVLKSDTGPFLAVILNPTRDPNDLGYSWAFARSDTVAIGTGVRRSLDTHLLVYRASAVRVAEKVFGYKCTGFTNWIIPIYRQRRAAKENLALIGDALGTADPLFVEGIASGLYSAKVLVDAFHSSGDFSTYQEALAAHPYFRSMRLIAMLQRRGNADYELAFRIFSAPDELGQVMGMIAGTQTPLNYVLRLAASHPLTVLRIWLKNRGILHAT